MKTRTKRNTPIWSTKTVMMVAFPLLTVITLLVYALSNRSFFVETERAILAISICLFLFFAAGLYSGVRIKHPNKELETKGSGLDPVEWASRFRWGDVFQFLFFIDPRDLSNFSLPHIDIDSLPDGGDDLVGCLLTIVLWIVATIALAFLVWLLSQVLTIVVPMVIVGLYWITYRALKLVFSKSAECCKQLVPSLGYSLLYTVLYTGWLFVVVWIGRFVIVGE